MINEYALDPALIFEAAKDRRTFKQLISSFGVGTPRIVSIFPKLKSSKWEGYIRKYTPSDLTDLDHTRADELIGYLKENRIQRVGFSLDEGDWLHNVTVENMRLAFDVIFTNQDTTLDAALSIEQTYDIESIWDHKTQLMPPRTIEDLSTAINGLLRCSKHLVIVDPYAYKTDVITSIVGFIRAAFTKRIVESELIVQVYFDGTKTNAATADYLFEEIKKNLSDEISNKVHLHIFSLAERNNSEKLHNRYVMSELGGVQFGIGTDIGKEFHTDDLVLMNKDTYEKRWEQYIEGSTFIVKEEKLSK